jgi:hypothetical protein
LEQVKFRAPDHPPKEVTVRTVEPLACPPGTEEAAVMLGPAGEMVNVAPVVLVLQVAGFATAQVGGATMLTDAEFDVAGP